jgi:hypothetical protein
VTKLEVVAAAKRHNLRGSEQEILAFLAEILAGYQTYLAEKLCFLCSAHAAGEPRSAPAEFSPGLNAWTHYFRDPTGTVRSKDHCRSAGIRLTALFDGD